MSALSPDRARTAAAAAHAKGAVDVDRASPVPPTPTAAAARPGGGGPPAAAGGPRPGVLRPALRAGVPPPGHRPRQGHAVHRPRRRRRRLRPAAGRDRRPRAADRCAVRDRRGHRGPARHPRGPGGAAGRRPPRRDVGPGPGLPGGAAGHGVGPRGRRAGRLRPRPPELERRRRRAAAAARRLRRRRAGALRRPVRGRRVAGPPEGRARGELHRDLGARPAHRHRRLGQALCRDLRAGGRHRDHGVRPDDARARPPRGPRGRHAGHAAGDRRASGQFTVESRILRNDGGVRWMVSRGRVMGNDRGASRCGCSARSSTSPRPGTRPSSGSRRSTGRPRSPRSRPSWPTPPAGGPPGDRAARRAGAGRGVQRAGGLRPRRRPAAAAHDPAAGRRDPGARRLPRRGRRDRARRQAAHPVRGHARPAGAAGLGRGDAHPLPGDPRGHRDPRA